METQFVCKRLSRGPRERVHALLHRNVGVGPPLASFAALSSSSVLVLTCEQAVTTLKDVVAASLPFVVTCKIGEVQQAKVLNFFTHIYSVWAPFGLGATSREVEVPLCKAAVRRRARKSALTDEVDARRARKMLNVAGLRLPRRAVCIHALVFRHQVLVQG